jgi:hypothetical protein
MSYWDKHKPRIHSGLILLVKLIELMGEWQNIFYNRQYKVMGGLTFYSTLSIKLFLLQG